MNPQERVLSMLARANPEPDENFEVEADWTSYLATLEKRDEDSLAVGTQSPGPTAASRKRRTILLVVATVIAVALAGLGLGTERDDIASTQDLALANAFVQAHTGGDADEALSLMAPEAVLGAEITGDRAEYAALLDWFEATGHQWSVEPCAQATTGANDIVCPMQWGNAWSTALESGPYPGEFRFDVEDARITGFFISTGVAREYALVGEEVDGFRAQHFGDQRETMFAGGRNTPRLTPESIALWGQMTAAFVQETSQDP